MKKMILALVAVLAIAGVSFAELTITVEQQADPWEGLQSFLVKTTGADSFDGVMIAGAVHQTNADFGAGLNPSMFADSLDMYGGAGKQFDTHFMFNAGDALKVNESMFKETNSKANEMNITSPAPGVVNWYGLGTFDTSNGTGLAGTGSVFVETWNLTDTFNFMQIVIPTNTQVLLTGLAAIEGGVEVRFSQVVGVPEPSTVLLLVAGFACLLVARFRK